MLYGIMLTTNKCCNMEGSKELRERVPSLTYADKVPFVWDALKKLERTGWVNRGIKNPETVAEHTIALRELAFELPKLTDEEKDGLLDMLEVHDWPEALCGDEVIIEEDVVKRAELKRAKMAREDEAMKTICKPLGDIGKEIYTLWIRHETSKDPAAILGREIDKYQAIEQALVYEKMCAVPNLFEEFLRYTRPYITHPVLLDRLTQLEQDYATYRRTV